MTTAIVNLLRAGPATAAPAAADGAGSDEPPFAAVLASKRPAASAASSSVATAPAAANPPTAAALARTIAALRARGATTAQIVDALAAQLAAISGAALAPSDAGGRTKLRAAFVTALAPPGDPGGGGDGALAQRAAHVARLAAGITGAHTGQQKRIAGTTLDATPAKDHPAPNAEPNATRSAADAPRAHDVRADAPCAPAPDGEPGPAARPPVSDPVAAAAPVAVAAALPVAVAAAGDGRTARTARAVTANGGDTAVGRLLARAATAEDARNAARAPRAVPPASPRAAAGSVAPAADAAPGKPAPTLALDAFVSSLSAALHDAAPPSAAVNHEATVTALTAATAAAPAPAPQEGVQLDRAVPHPAALPPAFDQGAVVDQIVRGVSLTTGAASSELRLTLVPQTLGDISVKLVVSGGGVSAHIVAQTPEARDALVSAAPQLSRSLSDAGLKLQSFTVDWSGSGFAGSGRQQEQSPAQDGRRRRVSALGAVDDADSADEGALDAIPSFAPPSLVIGGATDYDYLA